MKKISYQAPARFAATATYIIEGIKTESDEEILDFCDPNNFGGYVTRYSDGTASVEVYID